MYLHAWTALFLREKYIADVHFIHPEVMRFNQRLVLFLVGKHFIYSASSLNWPILWLIVNHDIFK